MSDARKDQYGKLLPLAADAAFQANFDESQELLEKQRVLRKQIPEQKAQRPPLKFDCCRFTAKHKAFMEHHWAGGEFTQERNK